MRFRSTAIIWRKDFSSRMLNSRLDRDWTGAGLIRREGTTLSPNSAGWLRKEENGSVTRDMGPPRLVEGGLFINLGLETTIRNELVFLVDELVILRRHARHEVVLWLEHDFVQWTSQLEFAVDASQGSLQVVLFHYKRNGAVG